MFKINALGSVFESIEQAKTIAPYIDRLSRKFPNIVEELKSKPAQSILDDALNLAKNAANLDINSAMRDLRHAKSITHLTLSGADLAQQMPMMDITGNLSNLCLLYTSRFTPFKA